MSLQEELLKPGSRICSVSGHSSLSVLPQWPFSPLRGGPFLCMNSLVGSEFLTSLPDHNGSLLFSSIFFLASSADGGIAPKAGLASPSPADRGLSEDSQSFPETWLWELFPVSFV